MPTASEAKSTRDEIRLCTLLPNGLIATVSSSSHILRFWDGQTGKPRGQLDTQETITCLAVIPPNHIALGHDHSVSIWNLDTQIRKHILRTSDNVASLTFSVEEHRLIGISPDHCFYWDGAHFVPQQPVRRGESVEGEQNTCLALAGGRVVEAFTGNTFLDRWDLTSGRLACDTYSVSVPIRAIAASSDGRIFIGFKDNIQMGNFTFLNPRRRSLAGVSSRVGVETDRLCCLAKYHVAAPCLSLVISNDRRHFVSSHAGGYILLWNVDILSPVFAMQVETTHPLLLPEQGGRFGFYSRAGDLCMFHQSIHDLRNDMLNQQIDMLDLRYQTSEIYCMVNILPKEAQNLVYAYHPPITSFLFRPLAQIKESEESPSLDSRMKYSN